MHERNKCGYNYTLLGCIRLLPIEQKGWSKNYRQWYKQSQKPILQKARSLMNMRVNEYLARGEVGSGGVG